jgi:DNA-binding transcriptional ArsR family regulator
MSIAAMNWVKRMHKTRIKSTPRSVLREMADYADDVDECWPSVETLTNCTSLSERAVQEALRILEEMGLITTFQRFKRSSRYRLNRDVDLASPLNGAPSAPSRRRIRHVSKDTSTDRDTSTLPPANQATGADGAPLKPEENLPGKGAESVVPRVQILQVLGAPAAPKPPENHHRTLGGGRVRARPTPLSQQWQPSREDEAYARRLGLDPAVVAERFRKQFVSTGKALANWSVRWELWCDEDAAKTPPAANSNPTPPAGEAGVQATDPDGLDASDRSWVVTWEKKRALGQDLCRCEATMRDCASSAFVVVQRLKAETAVSLAAVLKTALQG